MKTGGGEEEKVVNSPNPDVEALLGKPHIVEWCNDYDGDSVLEKPVRGPKFQNPKTLIDKKVKKTFSRRQNYWNN